MKRNILEKLINWKHQIDRKPLILQGARQIGKTYILKEFAKENFDSSIYINFEKQKELFPVFEKNLDPQRIISELGIILNRQIEINTDLLIFDEIQCCPSALTSLKYFCEEMPKLAICSAGSLLGVFLNRASFPVGKVEFLNMFPVCFAEYLLALGEDKLHSYLSQLDFDEIISESIHSKAWSILKKYLIIGGLPESINTYLSYSQNEQHAFLQVREKQDTLVQMYLADIAKYSGQQNSMQIERIWKSIPSQLGREQENLHNKFIFKDVIPGVKAFSRLVGAIDWLEKTNLIIKVPIVKNSLLPLSSLIKENYFKAYCFDIGILSSIGDIPIKTLYEQESNSYKGFIAENFVAQELYASNINKLFSWKSNTAEIEFLVQSEDQIIPIEVKSGKNIRSKSLTVYQDKYKPKKSFILSAQNFGKDTNKSLSRIPIYLAGFLHNRLFRLDIKARARTI